VVQRGKGLRFISQDGGGADVFVHYSEIDAGGFRSLDEGQRVEFTIGQGAKGPRPPVCASSDLPLRQEPALPFGRAGFCMSALSRIGQALVRLVPGCRPRSPSIARSSMQSSASVE